MVSDAMTVGVIAACPFPFGRGTPVRIQRLSEGLAARGHRVHVATYHLGERVDLPGVTVHRTPDDPTYVRTEAGPTLRKSLVLNRRLVALVARLIREQAFDVIHAHHVEGLVVGRLGAALAGKRVPIVFDQHTSLAAELPYYAPAYLSRTVRMIGAVVDRALPRLADHVTTVTHELQERLLQRKIVAAAGVTTIGNGLEFELFEAADQYRATRPAGETLVFSGNLAAYQGIELMLRAFALILRHRPHARLRILSAEDFAPYGELARDLGVAESVDARKISFDRVPRLLAEADVALNPRLDAPGMPLKTLNYLASGLPIVTFAGSGHHLRHEETALIVPDGDVGAFAEAILRLLSDPALAQRLSRTGLSMVRAKSSWEQSAADLEATLQSVCLGRCRRPMRAQATDLRDQHRARL